MLVNQESPQKLLNISIDVMVSEVFIEVTQSLYAHMYPPGNSGLGILKELTRLAIKESYNLQ